MAPVDHLDASNRDPAVAPGEDFFRFTNGGWLKRNPVPPEYGSWSAFHEIQVGNEELLHRLLEDAAADPGDEIAAAVGAYYVSGMDVEAIEKAGTRPIADLIEAAGSVADIADLRRLAERARPFGVALVFGMYVAPDFDESSRYLLYMGQGGLGLPERDYYLRQDERSEALRQGYLAHITAQMQNLGIDPETAQADASSILSLETELAGVSYSAEQLRDVDLTTNKLATPDLAGLMGGFDLAGFLVDVGAPPVEAVNLNNPGFFTEAARILSAVPPRVLAAYSRWHVLRAFASALPAAFEDESFSFYGKMLGGQQKQKERWKRVLGAATREMGESVSRLYVREAFGPEAKARCESLVVALLDAMRQSIASLTWMSDATKARAAEKLGAFGYKIGYPDKWKGIDGLTLDGASWVENRMAVRAYEFHRDIARLGDPVDDTEWSLPAHVVNAYYHPLRNEVVFPAGILQPPFFYADGDDALNFGGIGTAIGHEITHGFDDQGSRFDADGHLRDWWAAEDREEFLRRAEVVVAQFAAYEVEDGLPVNGRLTLGENIADLGGVAIAYDAFRSAAGDSEPIGGFTPEQRFFLSYGTTWRQNYTEEYLRLLVNTDPHSPAVYRCNGPLGNMPEFASSFGLDESDPMIRPESERAEIW